MTTRRLLRSPLLVFLAGLAATFSATAISMLVFGLPAGELGPALVVGLATTAVTAATSAFQQFALSRRAHSLQKVEHDAKHDALTGLINRTELYRQLDVAVAEANDDGSTFGVLFLDLDRFKAINDSLGHDAGDELLRIVAERLKAATRSSDAVARLGGDEFVIVARGLFSPESVVAIASQVLRRFADPVNLNGRQQSISTSIGVAIVSPPDGRSAEELLRDADAAMYKAKQEQTGYAVFDEDQRSAQSDRKAIEADLVRSLDNDELVVHYQPIVDMIDGRLVGFEALVRWAHPTRGLLVPEVFLGAAVDSQILSQIEEMVLREACAQTVLWRHDSPEADVLRVHVNMSRQLVLDSSYPHLVADVLAWSGLDPQLLVMEIGEATIVEELDDTDVLHRLSQLGVSVAIDDFGTGRSALGDMGRYDVASMWKIDHRLIAQLRGGTADRAGIEAVVTMATALGVEIVAEGVESDEDVDQLLTLGVSQMQGYRFGRPTSPTEIGAIGDLIDSIAMMCRTGLAARAGVAHSRHG